MSGQYTSTPTKLVHLFGGPLNGKVAVIPRGKDELRIGSFFRYVFFGRKDAYEIFIKWPRSRSKQRAIRHLIGEGKVENVYLDSPKD